jgi:hypothetical protein
MALTATPAVVILAARLPSWRLALDAASMSPKTIISRRDSVKRLEAYLDADGLALQVQRGARADALRYRP